MPCSPEFALKKFFFKIYLLIYLSWPVVGLCCYMWVFSSCGKWVLLFIVVCRLLMQAWAVASPGLYSVGSVVEGHGLSSLRRVGSSRTRD